jgi:hypothetical protein
LGDATVSQNTQESKVVVTVARTLVATLVIYVIFWLGLWWSYGSRHAWKFLDHLNDILVYFLAVYGIVVSVYYAIRGEGSSARLQTGLDHIDMSVQSIDAAERKLQNAITNLEDATRRHLEGFDQIFLRALWLLQRAQDDILYVNFILRLGTPHEANDVVTKQYTSDAKRLNLEGLSLEEDYRRAVNQFFEVLSDKALKVDRFRAVLLNPDQLKKLSRSERATSTQTAIKRIKLLILRMCCIKRNWRTASLLTCPQTGVRVGAIPNASRCTTLTVCRFNY